MEMSMSLLLVSTQFSVWVKVWVLRERMVMSDQSHCLFYHGKCALEQCVKMHPQPSVHPSELLPCCGLWCCSCYECGHYSELYFRGLGICFCCLWDFLLPLHFFGAEQYVHLTVIEELSNICVLPEITFSCRFFHLQKKFGNLKLTGFYFISHFSEEVDD